MGDVKVIQADSNLLNRRRKSANVAEQIRVAPYCRVSTDSEEQLLSYNSQVVHYKQLIESNPTWELVEVYADEGITGTQTTKRIAFQKMINDALEGKIDLIITKSISRFARNTLDTLKYVRLLKEHNVAILFEKENINTLTMNGEMLLVILSSLAQQESESISANVKMGLKMKMKRGEMIGFQGCLGYDYNPIDKTIVINEEEAETVRYIFRRYVEGAGAFVIAKELTNMKCKTKKGNERWHESTVRGIIKNEKYKGDLLMGKTFTVDPITHRRLENMGEEEKYYVSNHHEPIISEELFEEAQKILRKRSSCFNNKGRSEKYSRKHAFSSMIECGFCGGTAIRRKWHSGTNHETYNWQCSTSIKHGRKACAHSKGVKEKYLQEAFVQAFNRINKDNRDMIEEFLTNIEEALDTNAHKKDLEKIKKEISSIEKKAKNLVDLRINGTIDIDDYEDKYQELSEKLTELKEEKMNVEITLDNEKSMEKRIKAFRKVFNTKAPLERFDREIFESLVEKVILGDIDEDGNKNPYVVIFVLKTGIKLDGNCKGNKKSDEESTNEKTCSLSSDDSNNSCSYTTDQPCRDRLSADKKIDVSALENGVFTVFSRVSLFFDGG